MIPKYSYISQVIRDYLKNLIYEVIVVQYKHCSFLRICSHLLKEVLNGQFYFLCNDISLRDRGLGSCLETSTRSQCPMIAKKIKNGVN